jgi:predicted nucleotidyltransferase component of viral defense system
MIKNAKSLKDQAKNIAKENNISIQQVLQNYMFERILERLSKSKYKENFIIKGGLLLSSIMGINLRTTMDIDTNVTGINLEKNELLKILSDILNTNIGDNVSFEIEKIEDIKQEENYGGYKFKITGIYENIKIKFHIDISTGDVITPKAIEYKYKKLFDNSYIDILSYNQETIIAEKFQSILERKITNSRMKDYYDLYFFVNYRWDSIDKEILSQAIVRTFSARNSITELRNIKETIKILANNPFLNRLWLDYSQKHEYSKNVSFNDTIKAIEIIEETIFSSNELKLLLAQN